MLRFEIVVFLQYSAGINRTLDCPKSIVGRVIGKGGDTIKQMQRTFGANIQIDQQQDPMKITIAGPAQAVDAAASAIREIINGGNPYLGGPGGGGFGGQGGPGFGPGGRQSVRIRIFLLTTIGDPKTILAVIII